MELSTSLINKILDDKGIILIEATEATKEPLRLEVTNKSNQRLAARAELALNIDGVETMYRNIDLKSLATRGNPPDQGLAENIAEPTNNKDDRTQPNYLAFIHGYRVSPEAARGWNAELFKRYHRLGFNGRFIATNWHGDTGLDYHNAVYNALQTGMGLKTAINRAMPEPGTLTIAAHSLGNMVASNAISYGGLTPVKYFMINAAAPIEAYDSAQDTADGIIMNQNMTEVNWKDYPEALYSANWHELFAGNPLDNRNQLTWKNHFSSATSVAYNFYSPGDEVVENANANENFSATLWNNLLDVDFEQHTWVMQEMGKGCKGLISWFVFECSGGWEFNTNQNDYEFIGKENPDYDFTDPSSDEYIRYADGLEATTARDNNSLTDENLAQYGFFFKFNHFENNESEYSYLYQPITNPVLSISDQHQWDLLASGIPAMSFAAAANLMDAVDDTDVGGKDRNFNMETLRGSSDPAWPSERISSRQKNWLHSDFRNVALPYVYQTLDKMLELGEFKE